jgi:hypothetical protein
MSTLRYLTSCTSRFDLPSTLAEDMLAGSLRAQYLLVRILLASAFIGVVSFSRRYLRYSQNVGQSQSESKVPQPFLGTNEISRTRTEPLTNWLDTLARNVCLPSAALCNWGNARILVPAHALILHNLVGLVARDTLCFAPKHKHCCKSILAAYCGTSDTAGVLKHRKGGSADVDRPRTCEGASWPCETELTDGWGMCESLRTEVAKRWSCDAFGAGSADFNIFVSNQCFPGSRPHHPMYDVPLQPRNSIGYETRDCDHVAKFPNPREFRLSDLHCLTNWLVEQIVNEATNLYKIWI